MMSCRGSNRRFFIGIGLLLSGRSILRTLTSSIFVFYLFMSLERVVKLLCVIGASHESTSNHRRRSRSRHGNRRQIIVGSLDIEETKVAARQASDQQSADHQDRDDCDSWDIQDEPAMKGLRFFTTTAIIGVAIDSRSTTIRASNRMTGIVMFAPVTEV